MGARNRQLCLPNEIFQAPRVVPTLSPVADTRDEFAASTADSMGLEESLRWARSNYDMRVSEAAYSLAQKRGFKPGRQLDDWVDAEAQITGQSKALESGFNG